MTGKELLLKTMCHQETPRAPWVPFAGVHAGKLKGYTATEVLTDANKLYECLLEVNRLYMPDGQPIVFDLQLEAEILGCGLMWADDNPPSVSSHPWEEEPDTSRQIEKTDGRLPMLLEVSRKMKEAVGDHTALYGLFCGPFTLVSHLRGTKMFMDMKKRPELVRQMLDFATETGMRMVDFYIEAGMDILAPVDPLVSQISPKNFVEYMAGPYTRLLSYIRDKGRKSAFFVCGNALRNLEEMCKTGPDAISIDENIPMATAKAITDPYNVAIGGNIPLTTTMLFGNQMDNIKFVVDMVDSVPRGNLIIAPGCDMPYDVPVENTIAVAEAARDVDKYRELVKDYESVDDNIEIQLPDYQHLPRPLIEAFTLDSGSCAACTYMWATACDAKKKYGDAIDVVEYKYNKRENIARCRKMGVSNLPTLYINGEPKYVSIIPSQEEFFAQIDKLLAE